MSWPDLVSFFGDRELLPHASCLLWRPDLLWLHAASDLLIGLAYYSIPIALAVFVIKRRDLHFRWIYGLFGLFILACGTTHFVGIVTMWIPAWAESGVVKAVTAVVSVATATLLWPVMYKMRAEPGQRQWKEINAKLVREVDERRAAEMEVRRLNRELEARDRCRIMELQALRQAKQDAERANQTKGKFLAAASHDLRQPVQSLMLFSSLLANAPPGHVTAKTVNQIDRSVQALKTLLDGILDISRLDAGSITPQVKNVPLGPLLEQVVNESRVAAEAKGLQLKSVASGNWIRTDPLLLERILRNLVVNAIKYTRRGKVLVGCRRQGGYLRIEVHDTGIGIPEDQKEAVFEEFHQLDNPERDRSKGLGLGLAIVHRLAGLLDHPVSLTSTLGKGTTVAIATPLGAGVVADCGRASDVARQSGGVVVVIEDEEDVRDGLREQLRYWGYDVVAGADTEDIMRQIGDRHPNIILADFRLRGSLTGIEAVASLHRIFGHRVPSALLTGDTAVERISEARTSGCHLFHKPIPSAVLREYLSHMERIAS